MNEHQQALADMPMWLWLVLALVAGVSGEAWRADKAGLTGWALVKRIGLRSAASAVFGLATFAVTWACGAHILVAVAVGCIVATMGADVASALYERAMAKRLGVCETPGSREADG
ncbi:MAG: pyocin R2, holin [Aquipseudomonas alcaligenes]|uniref:Pyocin R2, holin n=1 Tax=Aquipseudomonas alcaligenes TaxID=43263 RepID=A0A5C7WBN6_AQUAC|nr:MAG: pyocin R2, holin [Pseudomonas alcaligenes]